MVRVLTEAEIWEVLNKATHAHLGCHSQGKTYVVPVSFAPDGERIVGVTSRGMKIEMMRENPEVCLQFEVLESLTNWKSVVVWGRFEELEGAERSRCAGLLIDRYGPDFGEAHSTARSGRDVTPPRLDREAQSMIVYAIRIADKSGRSEQS